MIVPDGLERHSELVDKKSTVGLTVDEQRELDEINKRFDDAEDAIYLSVENMLEQQIRELRNEG